MPRLFAALLSSLIVFAASVSAQDYLFEGDVSGDDVGSYIYLEFDVPPDTTAVHVQYDYADVTADPADPVAGLLFNSVIDIGVFDPDGFRGWSGSNKRAFTVAASAQATSPSYIPGPLQAGTWKVELGVGWVDPGSTLHYHVAVDLSDEPVGEPYEPPAFTRPVLSDEAGWYKGDLHCHSTHSDGSQTLETGLEYARSIGLDFLAPTEHNAISHMYVLPELQPEYPDLLLIYGVEVTAYNGHYNVFGINEYVPYQGSAAGYDINAIFDWVHSLGGYVSPNHPIAPNIPVHGHWHGLGWGFKDTDWSKVDFLEAVNGPMTLVDVLPNPASLAAIDLWEDVLDQGHRMTIRGGSDDHNGGTGGGVIDAYIGEPTTVVWAEELSETAILDGIAKGHCFLMTDGPDGPELYLSAAAGAETAIVGDTIAGPLVELAVRIVGGDGTQLTLYRDGETMAAFDTLPIAGDDFALTVPVEPDAPTRFRAELWRDSRLLVLTNALFVEPGAPPADNDDDSGDEGDGQSGDDTPGSDEGDDDDDDGGCG